MRRPPIPAPALTIVGLALASLALVAALASPAGARRRPIAAGQTTIPWAVDAPRAEVAARLVAAALDLDALRETVAARYGGHIEVVGFALGAPRVLASEDGRPTIGRDLAMDLRVRVSHTGARLALGGDEAVMARLEGTAAARELADGCDAGELSVGMALVLPRSSPEVAHELGGIALRFCARLDVERQCLVHQSDGALVTTCHPEVQRERFEETVCNAAHLARKRRFMTSGAVACHHRWGRATLRYRLYALPGDAPTALNQGFVRQALAAWAGAGTELIRARYRARFLARHPVQQGRIAR